MRGGPKFAPRSHANDATAAQARRVGSSFGDKDAIIHKSRHVDIACRIAHVSHDGSCFWLQMTAVRIICTHDAKKLAETLARILGAEGDDVRLSYGRQSLDELPAARTAREAVLLIWSYDAPSAHYMLEWANAIAPERLAEIARAPGWPRTKRRAPVIDFAAWRGERAGKAWSALAERLRTIHRTLHPHTEPARWPAIGVGLAGAAAAGLALMISGEPQVEPKDVAMEFGESHAGADRWRRRRRTDGCA